jgi:hypothetical protein
MAGHRRRLALAHFPLADGRFRLRCSGLHRSRSAVRNPPRPRSPDRGAAYPRGRTRSGLRAQPHLGPAPWFVESERCGRTSRTAGGGFEALPRTECGGIDDVVEDEMALVECIVRPGELDRARTHTGRAASRSSTRPLSLSSAQCCRRTSRHPPRAAAVVLDLAGRRGDPEMVRGLGIVSADERPMPDPHGPAITRSTAIPTCSRGSLPGIRRAKSAGRNVAQGERAVRPVWSRTRSRALIPPGPDARSRPRLARPASGRGTRARAATERRHRASGSRRSRTPTPPACRQTPAY